MAVLHGHLEVVQWLAGNDGSVAQPDNNGATPLWSAAHEGHLDVVQWLAANGGSVTQPNNNGATPLCATVFDDGHLETVWWLASNGGSVTKPANNGVTSLYIAVYSGISRWCSGSLATADRSPSRRTPGPPRSKSRCPRAISRWCSG